MDRRAVLRGVVEGFMLASIGNAVRADSMPSGSLANTVPCKLCGILSIRDFGADPFASPAVNSVSIQNAINEANSSGKMLFINPGVYLFDTTLIFKNSVTYFGAGRITSILRYTGSADAAQINNPINASTAANIVMRDFYITCNARNSGKAALVDTGSTYLQLTNMGFCGNDHQLILDQTELCDISLCDFELPENGTSGVWIVNGADRTTGVIQYYSNRISISKCQFNGPAGVGIADDGGTAHIFSSNNFNALEKHIRINGCRDITINGQNEFEGASATSIDFANTRLKGGGGKKTMLAVVNENFFTGDTLVTFAEGSLNTLIFNGNSICTAKGVHPLSGATSANVTIWHGKGNVQSNMGIGVSDDVYLGNNANGGLVDFVSTWQSSATQPSIGNGTLISNYRRSGNQVTVNFSLTVGGTSTLGTGYYLFKLPVGLDSIDVSNINSYHGSGITNAGGSIINLLVVGAENARQVVLYSNNAMTQVSATVPANLSAGQFLKFSYTYTTTASLVA